MSGWSAAMLSVLFVVNPPMLSYLAAWPARPDRKWRAEAAIVAAMAAVVLGGVASLTGPLLDAVDLSGPTFRLGASVVMGITGARWMVSPPAPVTAVGSQREGVAVLLLAQLAPGPVFAAMAANADAGAAVALVAVAISGAVVLIALLAPRLGGLVAPAVVRLVGALALVVAVAIGIDSARTV